MKKNIFCSGVMMVMLIIASCSKKVEEPLPPPAPAPPATDKSFIQLKDVIIDHLPSPYFHFIYNDSGYVTSLDFASGLFKYELAYTDNRVTKMTDTNNDYFLSYQYIDGDVSSIKHINNRTGKPEWHYAFTYYNKHQLSEIRWFGFENNNKDSTLERVVQLAYYPDGELSVFYEFRKNLDGYVIWSRTVTFEDYDQRINVDGFYLLKDFFDDVLFLPQVWLQRRNPERVTSTSAAEDYTTEYSYQYNFNNVPLKKTGHRIVTKGPNTGKESTSEERFSYY